MSELNDTLPKPDPTPKKSWGRWGLDATIGAVELATAAAVGAGGYNLATGKGVAEAVRVAKIGAGIGAVGSVGMGNFVHDHTLGRSDTSAGHVASQEKRREKAAMSPPEVG